MSEQTIICVFAKAPVPGTCKTRLAVRIGDQKAARVQARLTERAITTAIAADVGPVQLWSAPDSTHPFFGRCRSRFGVTLHSQRGTDLGRRMANAIRLRRPCIIIGTDCPALTPEHLQRAATTLQQHAKVVVIPAEDGGYVLIGSAVNEARLFHGIDWGTGSVMKQTRKRLDRLGIRCLEAPPLWDVDHPADLERARREGFNI